MTGPSHPGPSHPGPAQPGSSQPASSQVVDDREVHHAWDDPPLAAALATVLRAGPARSADDPGAVAAVRHAVAALAATRDDPDRRELAAGLLGEATRVHLAALGAHAEADPRDADRWLLFGSALAAAAWTARGSAIAEHTSDAQVRGLLDLSARAQDALRHAAELAPGDPVPHSVLLSCVLGVGGTEHERRAAFDAVASRGPDLYDAGHTWLQMLAPKWYGSEEAMLAFARETAERVGPGHPLRSLVAMAHIEINIARADGLFGHSRSRRRIQRAVPELQAVGASLLAADAPRHLRSMEAHQVFAFAYVRAERNDLAWPHLERGGPRSAGRPWYYLGDADDLHRDAIVTIAGYVPDGVPPFAPPADPGRPTG